MKNKQYVVLLFFTNEVSRPMYSLRDVLAMQSSLLNPFTTDHTEGFFSGLLFNAELKPSEEMLVIVAFPSKILSYLLRVK